MVHIQLIILLNQILYLILLSIKITRFLMDQMVHLIIHQLHKINKHIIKRHLIY